MSRNFYGSLLRSGWLLLVLFVALSSPGAGQSPPIAGSTAGVTEVEPFRLVTIEPKPDQLIWVLPWFGEVGTVPDPIELVKTEDGGLVWTGRPGTYVVLWGNSETQGQSYVVIKPVGPPEPGPGPEPPDPEPGPDPTPVPVPRPDGFAGEVYDATLKASDVDSAKKICARYKAVLSRIDGGEITKAIAAAEEFVKINNDSTLVPESKVRDWLPFGSLVINAGREMTQDPAAPVSVVRPIFAGIVAGMEAANNAVAR